MAGSPGADLAAGQDSDSTMKKVTIRQATREDIDAIFQLDNAWEEKGVSYVFIPVSWEDFMADFERFQKYFFVAESENRIVGYVNGSVRVNDKVGVLPKQETYLEVENIYVLPEFRDRHVGGDFLDRLLAVAGENGIERFVVSTVTRDMDRILKFYMHRGFKPWYVELFK
jgi:ribosomal protein S18 acetylase RimI-like enzyme